jgi:hypothetical protein
MVVVPVKMCGARVTVFVFRWQRERMNSIIQDGKSSSAVRVVIMDELVPLGVGGAEEVGMVRREEERDVAVVD